MPDDWIDAGRAGELAPGKMRRIDASGRRVLLANVGPLHGSRFNVCTGEALEDPAEESLRTYPVRMEGERILIGLRQAGMP